MSARNSIPEPTPENIPQHELIGLRCRVHSSSDPGLEGLEGIVVWETKNTLEIAEGWSFDSDFDTVEVKCVPKAETVIDFVLTDEVVRVEGSALVERPADRVKMKTDGAR